MNLKEMKEVIEASPVHEREHIWLHMKDGSLRPAQHISQGRHHSSAKNNGDVRGAREIVHTHPHRIGVPALADIRALWKVRASDKDRLKRGLIAAVDKGGRVVGWTRFSVRRPLDHNEKVLADIAEASYGRWEDVVGKRKKERRAFGDYGRMLSRALPDDNPPNLDFIPEPGYFYHEGTGRFHRIRPWHKVFGLPKEARRRRK